MERAGRVGVLDDVDAAAMTALREMPQTVILHPLWANPHLLMDLREIQYSSSLCGDLPYKVIEFNRITGASDGVYHL